MLRCTCSSGSTGTTGAAPQNVEVTGTTPTNVQFSTSGIIAAAPANNMESNGGKIVIDAGSSFITMGGGVHVQANAVSALPPGHGGTPPGQGGGMPPGLHGTSTPGFGGPTPAQSGQPPGLLGGTTPSSTGLTPGLTGATPPGLQKADNTPPGQLKASADSSEDEDMTEVADNTSGGPLFPVSFVQASAPEFDRQFFGIYQHPCGLMFSDDASEIAKSALGNILIKHGRLFVSLRRDCTVEIAGNEVQMKKGTVAYLEAGKGYTRVLNLSDRSANSVRLNVKKGCLLIPVGCEAIVALTKDRLAKAYNTTHLARRAPKNYGDTSFFACVSEFSPISLVKECPMVRLVLLSKQSWNKQTSERCMKTIASLSMLQFGKERFSYQCRP